MAVVLAVLSPGMFPAGLAMAESAGTLAPVMRNGYARATESDAEGDLQDFDEENLDEVELEADLITDFDKNMEADQGGYARATDSDADEELDDIDLATASDARQVELATASDLGSACGGASGHRGFVDGLERQREFSGRRNPGRPVPDRNIISSDGTFRGGGGRKRL